MRKLGLALAAVVAVALVPAVSGAATGDTWSSTDTRELDRTERRELQVSASDRREARLAPQAANVAPVVGDERLWLGLDDAEGAIYVKEYTLRGLGDNIEVWVASDSDEISEGTDFPAGDCRNDGVRNVVTDAQVQGLIDEFDTNMYPIESEAFSVGPNRDGRNAPLTDILGLPGGYYRGPGDRIVTLIDNVRDENFYDTDNSQGNTYIAGFYFSVFDDYFNRQVMTIDSFDWVHRTGPNPPHEPSPDLCLNAAARPFLYEGVFAHEYQHLLENYVDFDETSWVNEGLSDYAQTITNYVDPTIPIDQIGFDSHIQCFQGFNNVVTTANPIPREGGPENSLTLWGDQTDFEAEVLCDYGAAYSFMEYLADQFGHDFLTALHLDDANGLDSVSQLLTAEAAPFDVSTVIERWAVMMAVDASIDDGWTVTGGSAAELSTETLNARHQLGQRPGLRGPRCPAERLRLRPPARRRGCVHQCRHGRHGRVRRSLGAGPATARVAGRCLAAAGRREGAVLGQGRQPGPRDRASGPGRCRTAGWTSTRRGTRRPTTTTPTSRCPTTEERPTGASRCTDSIDAPLGPGFEGTSDGFVHQRCNLRRWAGERVILAFRYVTDGSVKFDGFWVDDIVLRRAAHLQRQLPAWLGLADPDQPVRRGPVERDDRRLRRRLRHRPLGCARPR